MRAQVWNDNTYPHEELFKEKLIKIAPKSFVEFDALEDANEFKGQFTSLRTDGEKNPLPQFFKMIRIVPIDGNEPSAAAPLICHATGKVAANEAELAKMNLEHADKLDPESKKQIESMAKLEEENAALKARLAALEAPQAEAPAGETDEGRRGRPRK